MFTKRIALLASAAVVVVLGVSLYLAMKPGGETAFADCQRGVVAGGAATIGGPFTLVGTDGREVTDAQVITKPSLVYFGYGFCPDICPTDLSRNSLAAQELRDKGVDVGQIFISIDPERDKPDSVGQFVKAIDPRIIGLTGNPEQVAAAAAAYKVYYRKGEGSPGDYLMDHSTFTYLVAPGHGFLEFYGSDASPEAIATSVACFAAKI